ncbi:hypothetical protein BS50DRAFT_654891 [Corynespora cassiicola Philippines]|uniref:Uncharacterized protein n=1 Tax=Corynespora cassiicola Philippines TaxID=1448308 RepID=A0A2T2N514_CORCC|nr:hypothetical protein BS50DRAFT_654891 [Corynespora cassiicola Philippines]
MEPDRVTSSGAAAMPSESVERQEATNYWNSTMPQQEDLYLRLSQVLQYEILHHKQTRAELYAEQRRRGELENFVQQQAQTISHWERSYRIVHNSLEEHRAQNMNVKREMEAINAELWRFKQASNEPLNGEGAQFSIVDMSGAGPKERRSIEPMCGHRRVNEDADDGDLEQAWQLEFVRDVEEHFNLAKS